MKDHFGGRLHKALVTRYYNSYSTSSQRNLLKERGFLDDNANLTDVGIKKLQEFRDVGPQTNKEKGLVVKAIFKGSIDHALRNYIEWAENNPYGDFAIEKGLIDPGRYRDVETIKGTTFIITNLQHINRKSLDKLELRELIKYLPLEELPTYLSSKVAFLRWEAVERYNELQGEHK